MKKFIYFFLFLLLSFVANSQTQPSGLPSPRSDSGFAQYNWVRALKGGFIFPSRDTSFTPTYIGSVIYWANPAGDSSLWILRSFTGQRWARVVTLSGGVSSGTVTSVATNTATGIAGGTITTTGTLFLDTTLISTRAWRQKGVDSLNGLINARVKYSDTTSMLNPYLRKADTASMLSNYVPNFRAINTNAPLFGGGNLSTNRTFGIDTGRAVAQVATGGSLTAVKDSLLSVIASSGGGTVLSVSTTDGYGVISSVANSTSTPNISLRVDTVSISTRDWRQKGIDSVQSNLTSGLALKLNISDTASMLSSRLKISDTAAMLFPYLRNSDTAFMLSPYRRTTTKIQNSDLANSTISGISLGSNLATLTFGQYLQVGASSYNGSTATTITTNATSTNSGSTLVARDINGDFSARNISAALLGNASSASTVAITNDVATNATYYPMFSTVTTGATSTRVSSSKLTYNPSTGALSATSFIGNLTGNASTATVLQTARTINGVAFDGSANITISAAVGNSLSAGYGITGSPFDGSLARTWVIDTSNISTKANVTGALVGYTATGRFTDSIAAVRALANTKGTGTVTSVAASAGTGISVSGSPITTSGTITITNTAPDQTVTLTNGGNITITGTYPNFTLTNGVTNNNQLTNGAGYLTSADIAGKLNISDTASMLSNYRRKTTLIENTDLRNSAITINGSSTSLGGSISVGTVTSVAASAGTGISVTGSPITSSGTLTITNTAPDQTVTLTAGSGISVSGTYPNFTVTNSSPSSGGTVTSVSAGIGMSFTTITSTGAVNADTTTLATRAYVVGLDVGKANTSLNNVNGVLSSTYGGAGSVSGILKANGSGVVSAAVAGTDYVAGGTGTINVIPKFTASGTIGNSNISDDNVVVSFTRPISTTGSNGASFGGGVAVGQRLQVLGSSAPVTGTGLELFYDGTGAGTLAFARGTGYIPNFMDGSQLQFFTSSNESGRFASDGTFLINTTTTDGTNKLIVNGGVKALGLLTITNDNARNELLFDGNDFTNIYSNTTGGIQFGISNAASTGALEFLTANAARLTIASTGAATFSSSVTAASFIRSGGTSSQFLKADGSVDGNTYATTASIGNATLTLAVSGSGLSGSQTFTANQSSNATFTVTSNATTAATASTIAYRDGSGNLNAVGFFETSDKRKKDIFSVTKEADGIDFVGFKWKKELNLDNKKHLGVIAQQVEKVLPDAVNTDEKGDKSVNYTEVLLYKLENLTKKVEELEQKLERYSKKAKTKN